MARYDLRQTPREKRRASEKRKERNERIAKKLRHMPETKGMTNAQIACVLRSRNTNMISLYDGWSPKYTLEPLAERGLVEVVQEPRAYGASFERWGRIPSNPSYLKYRPTEEGRKLGRKFLEEGYPESAAKED